MPRTPVKFVPDAKTTARFWTNVAVAADGCWNWQGSIRGGYGWVYLPTRQKTGAHRYSYTLNVGPIPDGLFLDHLCRNPSCVNPAHLEPVTQRVNLLRGNTFQAKNAQKTHCIAGHLLAGDNLRIDTKGGRVCRACKAAWARQKRARVPISDARVGVRGEQKRRWDRENRAKQKEAARRDGER